MGSEAETDYSKFEERVKRSVYLDNMSPMVNEAVIKTAFEQYATVTSIQFIPNYTEPDFNSKCAVVEMENEKQAKSILDFLSAWPFMMSGMPRPVRGRPAEPEMFNDRPAKPGRKIQLKWLDPNDPDFQVAQKLKGLAKKHSAEQSFLLQKQLEEEEKLHKQQFDTLKSHYQKYESVDSIMADGTAKRLGNRYGLNVTDESRTFDF